MNKKGKANMVVILIAIAIVVVLFLYLRGDGGLPLQQGDITNGYYDEASGECRIAPDIPNNIPYIPGQITTKMYQCCFNLEDQQVDCNNPQSLWGGFAIYQGERGIFSAMHTFHIENSGNVDLTNIWIAEATWSPINTELTNAYASLIGSQYGTPLTIGQAVNWGTPGTPNKMDLQILGAGGPNTYTTILKVMASAEGLPNLEQTYPMEIIVTAEGIGFSVDIDLAA